MTKDTEWYKERNTPMISIMNMEISTFTFIDFPEMSCFST